MARLGAQRYTLGRGTGGGVGNGEHGDDGTNDDGGRASASGTDQGVAITVVGFHRYGRHGQVGAVDGDHGGLSKAGLWIEFLDGWVNGNSGDDEEDDQVDLVAVRFGKSRGKGK